MEMPYDMHLLPVQRALQVTQVLQMIQETSIFVAPTTSEMITYLLE